MLNWTKRNRYRQDVLAQVLEILFETDPAFAKKLKSSYPGIDKVMNESFSSKRNAGDLAVKIAGILLTDIISKMTDVGRRHRIGKALQGFVDDPGAVSRFHASGCIGKVSQDVDSVQCKLQWAVIYVSNLCKQRVIDSDTSNWFGDAIVRTLLGESETQRSGEGPATAPQETPNLPTLRLDESDDSPLLPADLSAGKVPPFSGVWFNIRPKSTETGIVLLREDDGSQVIERRALTQEDLKKMPLDAERYRFVNLQVPSGDIHSCVITEPGMEVYGSMRAFWWSLAHVTVFTTDARVDGTRMSKAAFGMVFGAARTMWDCAIKEAGSIDDMRDLMVISRNVHFEAISQMRAKESSEAARLGLDIAEAMVLATQSEDRKLEAYAYHRFRRFLWLPGEEPHEFNEYDAAA
jgi:hypothetical protein